MAFVKRLLDISFIIGTGQFGTGTSSNTTVQANADDASLKAGDTIALPNLRSSARVTKAGPPAMSSLQMDIWGMTASQMRELSTLGMAYQLQRKNTVIVNARNSDSSTGTEVFSGTVFNGWFDADSAPDTVFHVEAQAGLFEAVQPAAASAYPGNPNVVDVMQQLAGKMSLTLENNGVSQVLSSPTYQGSPRDQVGQAAKEAQIEWIIEGKTLAIWPKNKSRNKPIALVSKNTGLANYPKFTSSGIRFKTLFNPEIVFGAQVQIQVETDAISPANGIWNVFRIDHALDSQLPGGLWFSTVDAYNPVFQQAPISASP